MIDLKKFKKVSSDKHSTTMRHDDGHELKVVHSVLSPKLRKQVERLPMAEGGEVSKDPWEGHRLYDPKALSSVPGSSSEAGGIAPKSPPVEVTKISHYDRGGVIPDEISTYQPQFVPRISGQGYGYAAPEDTGMGDVKAAERPVPISDADLKDIGIPKSSVGSKMGTQGVPISEEIKHEDIFNTPQPSSGLTEKGSLPPPIVSQESLPSSYAEVNGKIYPTKPGVDRDPLLAQLDQITGAAQSPEMGRQVQQALTNNIRQNETIAQSFQNSKAKIDAEHQALVHDIMNGHINMGDYWKHNDKGAAALGALLGGMGSGLTGLANPVPGMIANSQENFLKAEQANLDNPKSLLAAVQAQYGDNKDAADVMRIISNEALNAHLQKVMAPLNSATAQANAAQVQMQLMQNTEALKQQIAMRGALNSGAAMNPYQKLLAMQRTGMIDTKDAEEATKELGKMDQINKVRSNLVDSFNDLNNKILSGLFSPNDRESAINAFAPMLEHVAEGRYNHEAALSQAHAILPDRSDSDSTKRNKWNRLHRLMNSLIVAPNLTKYNILPTLDVQPR